MLKFLSKFSKNAKNHQDDAENIVAIQEQTEPETKRTGYLEYWAKLGKRFSTKNSINKDELLKKLFPRNPGTMSIINQKTGVAMDSAVKPAMYTNDLPDEMCPFFTQSFIGWQACALLYQNPYIKKACEIPARDAIAVDYKLNYRNPEGDANPETDKEKEQDILNKLKDISDRKMKIKRICRAANVYKNVYGQILVCPTFSVDMTKEMEKPYNPSKIKKGTYTGMTVIQPFWVTYQLSVDGVAHPEVNGYYEPEFYIVNGNRKIHKSWIVKLVTGELPDILKPVYYFGGVPLTQQIYERVFCAEKTANEAPKLALTKRLLIVDGDVNNLTANPEEAYSVMEGVAELRDNMGFLVKNKGDSVSQIDTSLADMDALIMTQYQLTAAIAEMPVTKLMKTQLKGLANSGDYETKDYNQKLVEIQENDFDDVLLFHYELLSLSEYERDLGIDIVWNPIDTPTELEMSQIEEAQARTDATYVASGVIDASEVRTSLRNNEDSRFANLPEDMPLNDFGLNDLNDDEDNDADNN